MDREDTHLYIYMDLYSLLNMEYVWNIQSVNT